ncbi:MAG: hypothetical protein KJ069_04930 [Anaerolineae bacterium]|nr:hypothetical protein [Anaerolineae bacterium]
MVLFPSLDGFEPTRQTLHWYSQAVGIVPRAHGIAHPRWWHISLRVRPDGLVTDSVSLPGGGILALRLDLRQHQIVLETSRGDVRSFSMAAGLTGTEMGEVVITAVAEFGLTGEFARAKFENNDPRTYDPDQARRYFDLLVEIDRIFKTHKASLKGETGPVQVWPHGFDLAFEWFSARTVTQEEHGKVKEFPAQLNLGFYPGSVDTPPYFFSNPFPFAADKLLDKPLPHEARWHTEEWQGTLLPYAALVNDANGEKKLFEYAQAVYDLAAPTLM